ncbi:CapA family protein [Vulgatibacter incomptus]|uniref:Putative enzyme of poly-gamma-glutamate biosynthesis (Capsule formation) n=1 Tax=Vulgatibacter incomptus TaxID=1391653 RepID=A0A0K1P9T2_9BACT|nr:CapA family protein [Vulgatibacter incomptus]AKU90257.1 Putative enzyme of poly-gamma-glutamate biosynthesis (capsule formation) [Vulgatibacter incomptus]
METLMLAGDVMLGRGVREALHEMEPAEPWGDTLPSLLDASVRIVNLECAVTTHLTQWHEAPKVFHFRASPEAIPALRAARIDACSLANNHSLDFEEEGLLDTLRYLDEAGIAHAGAGRNREEATAPAILPHGIGLVACTDNEPLFAAGGDRPGTAFLPVSLEPSVLAKVEERIAAAREAGASTVVFSNHWGPNMVERPPALFRRFARAVIERGADIYFGHSAHLTQGVEIYRGKPILFDTGDFLDDYAVDPILRNDRSCLFRIGLEEGVPVSLDLLPVHLGFATTNLARDDEREAILARMEALSAELGTRLERRDGALIWRSDQARSG